MTSAVQLDLLPRLHVTAVYRMARLWGLDKTVVCTTPWHTWRCSCGRDLGAERRAAYGHQVSAERMAWWHRRNLEPWHNPLPGPPVEARS